MLPVVKAAFVAVAVGVGLLMGAGCSRPSSRLPDDRTVPLPRDYEVRGTVVQLDPARSNLVVRHEEIPGYMRAMTMPFTVRDTNLLRELAPGDLIRFRLRVTEDDGWIESVERVPTPTTNRLPLTGPFRVVREVEPLRPGDPLPPYTLTNQWGQPILTTQFRGQVLVLSFIYTRCPFPTFCPRTMRTLVQAHQQLQANGSAELSWHFLIVSFDPEYDTPEVLRAYGATYGVGPPHWTLATGAMIDVTALAEQFGLTFWREDGGWAHNLRTAVVDSKGRVRHILVGYQWTAEELARAIVDAARLQEPAAEDFGAVRPGSEPHTAELPIDFRPE
jgi:protein SCO1/2